MLPSHRRLRRTVLALALAASASLGQAQSERTVRILVGFPPGGSADTVARLLAEKMRDDLKGTTFVVDNKPGAGGRLAADLLKNAAPDGGTLMIAPVVIPVLAPLVFSKLSYNPSTDFAPVGHAANFDFAFTVPATLPAKNVTEWLSYVKANPAQANFGSPSAGSLPHFFGEMLAREARLELVHVPYTGGAPLMNALLGNQVSAGIDVVSEASEAHRAGKVRVLATSGERRSSVLPDVPTFKESGYPQIVASAWFAMYAPARTPEATITAYNRAMNKALAMPDVRERLLKLALEPGGGSPADLARLQESSTARWAPIVKATGFKGD